MLINSNLLFSFGAETLLIASVEVIFSEGDHPHHYYQIPRGRIKLNHFDENGKEIIQSILIPCLSDCELLLFINEKYPVNAKVLLPCEIIKIKKDNFFRLLSKNTDISLDKFLSERLFQKYMMMQSDISLQPDIRIIGALKYFKSYSNFQEKYSFEVNLTRKKLASMTGIRIETVIRTIKQMEKENIVKLENSTIFY